MVYSMRLTPNSDRGQPTKSGSFSARRSSSSPFPCPAPLLLPSPLPPSFYQQCISPFPSWLLCHLYQYGLRPCANLSRLLRPSPLLRRHLRLLSALALLQETTGRSVKRLLRSLGMLAGTAPISLLRSSARTSTLPYRNIRVCVSTPPPLVLIFLLTRAAVSHLKI